MGNMATNYRNPSTGSSSPFAPISSARQRSRRRARRTINSKRQVGRVADWRKYVLRVPPSDWVLVYDCETRTAPDQRLRFGAYQLRYKGQVWERGAFYEPEVLTPDELAIFRQCMAEEEANSDGERIRMLTRAAFVDGGLLRVRLRRRRANRRFQPPLRPFSARHPSRQRPAQHAGRI